MPPSPSEMLRASDAATALGGSCVAGVNRDEEGAPSICPLGDCPARRTSGAQGVARTQTPRSRAEPGGGGASRSCAGADVGAAGRLARCAPTKPRPFCATPRVPGGGARPTTREQPHPAFAGIARVLFCLRRRPLGDPPARMGLRRADRAGARAAARALFGQAAAALGGGSQPARTWWIDARERARLHHGPRDLRELTMATAERARRRRCRSGAVGEEIGSSLGFFARR